MMSESARDPADEFRMAGPGGREPRAHFGRDLWILLAVVMAGFGVGAWPCTARPGSTRSSSDPRGGWAGGL